MFSFPKLTSHRCSFIRILLRFGYTPLEEAMAMSNNDIIREIDKFMKENSPTKPLNRENDLEEQVDKLSQRVKYLEALLRDVSQIGGSLKNQASTAGGDPNIIKLAEKLASIDTAEHNR